MLGKVEARPPAHRPRDGRHCDLCGCSQPAVRCDKCGCQIFCLSCDDMYHRHPKRRFHLRRAVDPAPPMAGARPVLPAKAAQLAATSPGDPSKMPLPPPRKKKPVKSFFDTFRRRSPSGDNSPPLPKKEYSWTDRFGNIKKFMSNRPLPPLPSSNGEAATDLQDNSNMSNRHGMSFIHKRVEERPPQLPQRLLKPAELCRPNYGKENVPDGMMNHSIRNGTMDHSQVDRSREFGNNERNQWNGGKNNQANTLNRQYSPNSLNQMGSPGYPSNGMHQSSSATDLTNLDGPPAGLVPPHYPHPYPPMAQPHYPYPMYPPQFANYPQYFGSSFANLSSHPPTTDGDMSDHSEASSRYPGSRKYPFRKKAKRSQSVLVDRMAFPGQYFPFGPFPPGFGPGPWGAPFPMEAPPSPASSIRSLNRVGRTRTRRKKGTSEDEEDGEFSMSSSPLSRPKSSSSDRQVRHTVQRAAAPLASSDEEEESDEQKGRGGNRNERTQRKSSDSRRLPSPTTRTTQVSHKKISKHKRRGGNLRTPEIDEALPSASVKTERKTSRESDRLSEPEEKRSSPGRTSKKMEPPAVKEDQAEQSLAFSRIPSSSWHCKHCTFINSAGQRICQVCCKTASPEGTSRPTSSQSRKHSSSSEKFCSSPEKRTEEEEENNTGGKRTSQDMAVLNSALDEAEMEISRGLEELMKLKQDSAPAKKEQPKPSLPPPPSPDSSKPVYKSTGKMRSSILDKIMTPGKQQPAKSTTSTSTDTQTSDFRQTATDKSDRILEARRPSTTSSTTSDAYNSPMAQSPQMDRPPTGITGKSVGPRKGTSCQTQTDDLSDFLERRKVEEDVFFGGRPNGYGMRYGDRLDPVTSPIPSRYDRPYGLMQRSHSRASLFTGRMNDFGPVEFGFGATPMYRSVSRSSLTGDYPDSRFSEFHNLRKPEYFLSMEELVERRRQESIKSQGLELVRMIREAEQQGFNADDIQVAISNCGSQNPLEWLQENWRLLVENVIGLSASYANDKRENDVGKVSEAEAREALRMHKGHIWASVTECVESRQRKFLELKTRGKFSSKDITDALTSSQGDVELAYSKLAKSSSKPFLMRIWGAGEGAQNQDGAMPLRTEHFRSPFRRFSDDKPDVDDIQSDEAWEDEDVDWDEEEDDFDDQEDEADLQTCREDLRHPNDVTTPDSDRSDYCDASGSNVNTLDRNAIPPSNYTNFPDEPEPSQAKKGTGFLSKLVALRKEEKIPVQDASRFNNDDYLESCSAERKEDSKKSTGAMSVIRSTISAIRETVNGVSKPEKKFPCSSPDKRTIVVKDHILQKPLMGDNASDTVKLTSIKPLDSDAMLVKTYKNENTTDDNKTVKYANELKGTHSKNSTVPLHGNDSELSAANNSQSSNAKTVLNIDTRNDIIPPESDNKPSQVKETGVVPNDRTVLSIHTSNESITPENNIKINQFKDTGAVPKLVKVKVITKSEDVSLVQNTANVTFGNKETNGSTESRLQSTGNTKPKDNLVKITSNVVKETTSSAVNVSLPVENEACLKSSPGNLSTNMKNDTNHQNDDSAVQESKFSYHNEVAENIKLDVENNTGNDTSYPKKLKKNEESATVKRKIISGNVKKDKNESDSQQNTSVGNKEKANKEATVNREKAVDITTENSVSVQQKAFPSDGNQNLADGTTNMPEKNNSIQENDFPKEFSQINKKLSITKDQSISEQVRAAFKLVEDFKTEHEINKTINNEPKEFGDEDNLASEVIKEETNIEHEKRKLSPATNTLEKTLEPQNTSNKILNQTKTKIKLDDNAGNLTNFEGVDVQHTVQEELPKNFQENQNQNAISIDIEISFEKERPKNFQESQNLNAVSKTHLPLVDNDSNSFSEYSSDKKNLNSYDQDTVEEMLALNVQDKPLPEALFTENACITENKVDNTEKLSPKNTKLKINKTYSKEKSNHVPETVTESSIPIEKQKELKATENTIDVTQTRTTSSNDSDTVNLTSNASAELETDKLSNSITNEAIQAPDGFVEHPPVNHKIKNDDKAYANDCITTLKDPDNNTSETVDGNSLSILNENNISDNAQSNKPVVIETNSNENGGNNTEGTFDTKSNSKTSISQVENSKRIKNDVKEQEFLNTAETASSSAQDKDSSVLQLATLTAVESVSNKAQNESPKNSQSEIIEHFTLPPEPPDLIEVPKTEALSIQTLVQQEKESPENASTSVDNSVTADVKTPSSETISTVSAVNNSAETEDLPKSLDRNATTTATAVSEKKAIAIDDDLQVNHKSPSDISAVVTSDLPNTGQELEMQSGAGEGTVRLKNISQTESLEYVDEENKVGTQDDSISSEQNSQTQKHIPTEEVKPNSHPQIESLDSISEKHSSNIQNNSISNEQSSQFQDHASTEDMKSNFASDVPKDNSATDVINELKMEILTNESDKDNNVENSQVVPHEDSIASTSQLTRKSSLTTSSSSKTKNKPHSKVTFIEHDVAPSSSSSSSKFSSSSEKMASTESEVSIGLESTSQEDDSIANDNVFEESSTLGSGSRRNSASAPNPIDTLRNRFEGLMNNENSDFGPVRPQSPFRRMSFRSTKAVVALERNRDSSTEKPWYTPKAKVEEKKPVPKRSLKQQMEMERRVRKMVADKKCRTYRKAEIVIQLVDLNFEEEEAIQAANDCSSLEQAISFLQQECLLCTDKFPVSHIVSMVHCEHKACRDCIRAYFTVQIRDRNIMELLCPFCNEPDLADEDVAQDYFNHLDIMLKKLVDHNIHELFQRKLRDRVLMRDPSFKWCSQCSSGFIAMENLTILVCPDCNAVTCASCRRLWDRDHQGISCEEFATLKDAAESEPQSQGLAKFLEEDGIDCPKCHFRYALAKGGCMHFRCIQCQHDFCSGCSRPFKMGQKCGVSDFCAKLGLHAHHPRNCLFYLRDKEPTDLQRLLNLNHVQFDREPPQCTEEKRTCQVMEQKETADGMLDDVCGKDVEEGFAGLCRLHYVEYLGQLVNKHKVDPLQIFDTDEVELVLKRANIRLPAKRFREAEYQYRDRLVKLIQEELPLDKMEDS